MASLNIQEFVPFAPADMMGLVADVGQYPAFLPWVKAARIWQVEVGENYRRFNAELLIGYKAFRLPFATSVDLDWSGQKVATKLIKGPMKSLSCLWQFSPKDNGCAIDLTLDYNFSDPILRTLIGANINRATQKLVGAFTDEAHRRFGGNSAGQ